MPYLSITTNKPMNRKQKDLIHYAVSKAITIVPKEKPELLMSHYNDCASMILSGDMEKPCALVELMVLKQVFDDNDEALFDKLMEVITEIVGTVLEIEKNKIYFVHTGSLMWAADGIDIRKTILK
jgi:hypothetical protein